MSELAIVSSRPQRLRRMVEQNIVGSRRALVLASDPGKFLSTVQIGITLVGVLSGAFSGATLGLRLGNWLTGLGLTQGIADAISIGGVVVAITYVSLIIGELVPKQIALRNPEKIAAQDRAGNDGSCKNYVALGLAPRRFWKNRSSTVGTTSS